jgi:hypothetical protein
MWYVLWMVLIFYYFRFIMAKLRNPLHPSGSKTWAHQLLLLREPFTYASSIDVSYLFFVHFIIPCNDKIYSHSMAKSKRRKTRRKTRRGGVFPRQALQFVLICHGGNQQVTPEGQPDEFTVPNGVSVIMYVPAGMTCVSHLESPLTICRNGIPPQEIFTPGTLCPEYSLSTKDGDTRRVVSS